MSDSKVMSKFEAFRSEYEARQADRPRVSPQSSESLKAMAAEHGRGCEQLLEQFFNGLTTDEREEIIEKIDMKDGLNHAIIGEARRLYFIR